MLPEDEAEAFLDLIFTVKIKNVMTIFDSDMFANLCILLMPYVTPETSSLLEPNDCLVETNWQRIENSFRDSHILVNVQMVHIH